MKQRITNRLAETAKPRDKAYEVNDTEVSGLLLRVQPSGDRTYYCRYRLLSGQRGRIKIGPPNIFTATQAREIARQHIALALTGADPAEARREARAHTLESFIDTVYQPRCTHKTVGETAKRVKACFPDLLPKAMGDIRPMWIENWRAARLKKGRAAGTVNKDITSLRSVLSRAVQWGFLKEHPLDGLKPLREDQHSRPRYLKDAEHVALMAALDEREERLRAERSSANEWRRERGYREMEDLRAVRFADYLLPMVLLSLATGLRRGELFSLEWSDVTLDTDAPSLAVRGAVAKSGRTRHIPLNRSAQGVLHDWRSQTSSAGLVFKSPAGGRFDNINNSWRKVLRDAKLTDFRWHDLRHTFASRLVINGADLNVVRELLGHGDFKTTLRYAHLSPKAKAAAVALLDVETVVPFPTTEAARA